MNQRCLFVVISLTLNLLLSAQTSPGGVSGHTLWLPGPGTDSSPVDSKNLEEISRTHFNYNPVIDLKNADKTVFRNTVKDRFSLFVVFKSDTEDELPVLTVNHGRGETYLTNKELLSDNEFLYQKSDSKKGIIISYFSGDRGKWRRRNSISLEDFYGDDKEGKQQLMEVICFDRMLGEIERSKVESYLSLKYGISLEGERHYINSVRDTIWHGEKNPYSIRVTGIGRDDALGLYQKQSGNSEKDGLYIGFGVIDTTNAKNTYELQDNTLLLWGDNGGSTSLKQDKEHDNLQLMKRTWKMQPYRKYLQDTLFTQVRVDKQEMAYLPEGTQKKDEFLWLVVNRSDNGAFDYVNAHYYKQNTEDETTVDFNEVVWDTDRSGADLFTFITGPDFFIEYAPELNCLSGEGSLELQIVGGQAPYEVVLKSGVLNEEITLQSGYHNFENLASGSYELIVTDGTKTTLKETILLDGSLGIAGTLTPVWELKDTGVTVKPDIPEGNAPLSYQWRQGDRILSTDKEFTAQKEGEYILILGTSEGCEKELPFTVKKQGGLTGWKLYPNPVKASEPFTIDFNLDKESLVTIKINSMDGKLVSESDLGQVQHLKHTGVLTVSGVYLVTVTVNDVAETVSLIIK